MALPEIKPGLRCFPVAAGEKAPPCFSDWPRRASSDPAQIEAWSRQFPGCNWGATMDDGVVLDVDPKRGGEQTLLRLELEGWEIPLTLTASTASNGRHLYLHHPGGTRNGVDVLGPGVDVRSRGGYTLVPGSVVGGVSYRWIRNGLPQPAPGWLLERLSASRTRREPRAAPPVEVDPDFAVERALEWLEGQAPAVEGQGGDHRTFAVAAKLRDLGVPRERALEVLEAWNARCSPPWDLEELERKVANAWRYAQNPAGVDAPDPEFDRTPALAGLYAPEDVRLEDVLETRYLVKEWLGQGVLGQIFGPPSSGKTFVALHLAAHVAAGARWFGCRVRQGGVLFLGYEGGQYLPRRLCALRQSLPDLPWRGLPMRLWPMRHPLVHKGNGAGKPEGRKELEAALKAFRAETGDWPRLIVLDPLRDALGGSDSDVDLTAPLLQYLRGISAQLGATVLVIHHPGHTALDRGRGDSGIEGAMDHVIHVDGATGQIRARKQRDSLRGELAYRLRVVTLGTDSDGDPVTTCVVEQVDESAGLTEPEEALLGALRRMGDTIPKGSVKNALPDLAVEVREKILAALRRKRFVIYNADGTVSIGGGAAELF